MTWIIPTAIMASMSAFMLTAVFAYLYQQYREEHLIFWAFTGFGFGVEPLITLLSIEIHPYRFLTLTEQLAFLASTYFLLKGMVLFIEEKYPKWIYQGSILSGCWLCLGYLLHLPSLLSTIPAFLFISSVFFKSGFVLLLHRKNLGTAGVVLGWSMMLGSINILSYPVTRFEPNIDYWCFLLAALSTMAIGIGILLLYFQKVRQDLSESETRYRYLSMHDSLTGLYNRTYFSEAYQHLEKEQFSPLGLIICDVDGLKLINDTLGHDSGDHLLLKASQVIRESIGENDVVARIGGDEFAVLLPNTSEEILGETLKKIEIAIRKSNDSDTNIHLSISMGYSIRNDSTTSLNILFQNADNYMYRQKLYQSQSTRSTIVNTLRKTLEARDIITESHTERMKNMMMIIASAIEFPENRLMDLRLLAQFHDLGKVGIPDHILFKPGPLTPEEKIEMERHCEIGYRIAQASPDLTPIADWVLRHHEWWDGTGYPLKLKGEEIPLECRILAIIDAFDAMTHNRPYKKALTREAAIAELIKYSGRQFDPHLVKEFIKAIENTDIDFFIEKLHSE